MAEHRDADDFSPPPFSFALMGHLATGMVKAAVIALLLWGLGPTGWTASVSAGSAITTAVVVMVAIELATTGVERIFVLRRRHPDPGSITMTVIVAVLPLPIGLLAGLVLGPAPSSALTTMFVTTAAYGIALVTLERPWADGDTQADIRRKHEETRAMTREQFRSE